MLSFDYCIQARLAYRERKRPLGKRVLHLALVAKEVQLLLEQLEYNRKIYTPLLPKDRHIGATLESASKRCLSNTVKRFVPYPCSAHIRRTTGSKGPKHLL